MREGERAETACEEDMDTVDEHDGEIVLHELEVNRVQLSNLSIIDSTVKYRVKSSHPCIEQEKDGERTEEEDINMEED